MPIRACHCCEKPIVRLESRGRPADYCSIRCRRRLERRRAQWDRRAAACAEDGFLAINRDDPDRTEAQRQHWQQLLDDARATLGPRP
jgi:hypothetical protein